MLCFPSVLHAQPLWSIRLDADQPAVNSIGFSIIAGSDVLVFDDDAGRIVRIDRTGKVIGRIGAKGSGPGEFRALSWMGIGGGDSLYTWDGVQRRLSVFTPDGKFARAEVPEHGLTRPGVFGRLRDGRWLVVTQTERATHEGGVELSQDILHVGVTRSVRAVPAKLAESPSKRSVSIKNGQMYLMRELPAMDMGYLSACENGFLIGSGARREVRAFDANGKLLATINALREPTIIGGSSRKGAIDNWAGVTRGAGAPPTDPAVAAAFAKAFDAAIPAQMRYTEQFIFGTDRSIWIYPNPPYASWQILGKDGLKQPELSLAKDLFMAAANVNYVLAHSYGDNERLELWARPESTRGITSAVPATLGACGAAIVR